MNPKESTPARIAKLINEDAYLRARFAPEPGEPTYIHLRDLRTAVQAVATDAPLRILDYGCGGSPYRPLFPNAKYVRADLPDTPNLDYATKPDGTIDAPSGSFDLILSTQVLEHTATPGVYLRECHRLLAPGGRLYLTTHGFYEEHGCPYDFHRWTADGLRQEVEAAGFRTEALHKLTTGARALLQLLENQGGSLRAPLWHPFGIWQSVVRLVARRRLRFVHRGSDRYHQNHCVVPAGKPGHPFFLGLDILATKS